MQTTDYTYTEGPIKAAQVTIPGPLLFIYSPQIVSVTITEHTGGLEGLPVSFTITNSPNGTGRSYTETRNIHNNTVELDIARILQRGSSTVLPQSRRRPSLCTTASPSHTGTATARRAFSLCAPVRAEAWRVCMARWIPVRPTATRYTAVCGSTSRRRSTPAGFRPVRCCTSRRSSMWRQPQSRPVQSASTSTSWPSTRM